MKADLHIHSNFSDGTLSPEEIFKLAKEKNIELISITDHDNICANIESKKLSEKYNIKYISGIEFTTYLNDLELHILGYLKEPQPKLIIEIISELRDKRKKRFYKIIENLKKGKIVLDNSAIYDSNKSLGRPHIAKMLVDKGYAVTLKSAYNTYLSKKSPYYVPKFKLSPHEAIELIKKIKGIPVLAHPATSLNNYTIIDKLIKAGLMGLEVIYPEHTKKQTKKLKELAKSKNLIITGGSDFHGEFKGMEYFGNFTIDIESSDKILLELLKPQS